MKTMRRFNRMSGTTRRLLERIISARGVVAIDNKQRHYAELQKRYWQCKIAGGTRP